MEKEFNELRKLLLSIDGKHFTWNDARASVLNQLHDLQSKVENLYILDVVGRSEQLKAFVDEFIEAWEDGKGGDSDLYRKAKSL